MDKLFVRELLLCSFLFAAGISDMYLRKVRNRMIVFFFLLSMILSLLWGEEIFAPLLPAFLIMLLLFPFYFYEYKYHHPSKGFCHFQVYCMLFFVFVIILI